MEVDVDVLVDDAVRGCEARWEQVLGFYGKLQRKLALPFETQLLGRRLTVEGLSIDDHERIVAEVRQGDRRRALPLLELPLPSPAPAGVEWIAAYRHYLRRPGLKKR